MFYAISGAERNLALSRSSSMWWSLYSLPQSLVFLRKTALVVVARVWRSIWKMEQSSSAHTEVACLMVDIAQTPQGTEVDRDPCTVLLCLILAD